MVQQKENESTKNNKETMQNILDIDDITTIIHFFNYNYE
jgi:hypothetical protein